MTDTRETEIAELRSELKCWQAEFASLKVNADRAQAVLNQSANAILLLACDGTIEFANAAAEQVIRSDHLQVVGRQFVDLVEGVSDWPALLKAQREPGLDQPQEQVLRTRCGALVPVELQIFEVFLDEGRIYTARLRDISLRKQHEQQVLDQARRQRVLSQIGQFALTRGEQQEFLQAVVELCRNTLKAHVGVLYLLATDQGALILRASDGWSRPADHLSIPVPSDSPAYKAMVAPDASFILRSIDDPDMLSAPARAENLHSLINVRIGDRDTPWGVIGFACKEERSFDAGDVSFLVSVGNLVAQALAHDQALLRVRAARDQAVEAARAKSDFLANMSHELRTPLNGVLGMLDLLNDTPLSETQRDYARVAAKSGRALLDLINDVLDFSKLESGKLSLEDIDFDCRLLLEDVIEMLAERAHRKGLEVACLVSAPVPARIQGDPGRLRQILMNLIGNAIKFTESGEVIARLGIDPGDSSQLRFEIADTGIGIPQDRQVTIFESFSQADSSTTRQFGGTGLGLTICKRLVEHMDGRVGVDSSVGQGSTFWFTVPLVEAQLDKAPTFMPLSDIRNTRLALFERNASSRAVIAEYLSRWGIAVSSFASEQALCDAFRDTQVDFDVAVLDLRLAQPGSIELVKRLRADQRLSKLKLIVATPLAERGDGGLAREAGINGYLVKPVRYQQLHDCIAGVMGFNLPDSSALVTRHSLEENSSFARSRMLIVDDVDVNLKVAAGMLKRFGVRADTASSGQEALRAIERQRYDLIFMDCQMPGMDGYQTTAAIRDRMTELRHIPVVAMTANALPGDREKCLDAGMDDYLAKPFKPNDLQAILNKWLPDRAPGAGDSAPGAGADMRAPAEADDAFDPGTFEMLVEVMGAEGIKELIAAYRKESGEHVAVLRDPAAPRDDTVRAAHSLKASSGNLGARRLQRLCAELEKEARAGEVLDLPAKTGGIVAAHRAALDYLANWLG